MTDRKTYAGIFFDLDDTLIEGYMYPAQPYSRVAPLPGRVEMLAELIRAGIKLGIASNQGGVGLGYITPKQAEQKRIDVLAELDLWGRNVPLLMVYDHPDAPAPWSNPHQLSRRKPKPGMLLELAAWHKLSPDDCLYVGDRPEDQQAAENAGMALCHADHFFHGGYGLTLARIGPDRTITISTPPGEGRIWRPTSGVYMAPIGTPPPEPGQPWPPEWQKIGTMPGYNHDSRPAWDAPEISAESRAQSLAEFTPEQQAAIDRINARQALAELQRRGALDDPTGQALGEAMQRQALEFLQGQTPSVAGDPHAADAYRAHRIDSSENGPLGSPAPPRLPLDDRPIWERYPMPAPEDRARLDAEWAEYNDRQSDAMRQDNQRRRPRKYDPRDYNGPILDDQPDSE